MAKRRVTKQQAAAATSGGGVDRAAAAARRWLPWILIAVTVVVFAQTSRFDFLNWDDRSLILDNPLYNPVTTESILRFWRDDFQGFYSPLIYTLWGIEALTMGLRGDGFHLVSLALHASNVVLVYLLVRRLLESRRAVAARAESRRDRRATPSSPTSAMDSLAAACGALVFAVHPLQAESVAWVTATKDLLATFFSLLAMNLYFAREGPFYGRMPFLPRGTIAYVLALLAKPSVVVLGPIVLVLDVTIRGTPWRTALRGAVVWLILAVPVAVVTKVVQPSSMLESVPALWFRAFVALDALQFYALKTVAPVGLAPDYGRTPEWLLETGAWTWSWLVPAGLLVAALVAASRGRWEPAGLLGAFALALAPVLGIVPFLFQRQSTVADHYMYFALVFVALAVAVLLQSLPDRVRAPATLVALGAGVVLAALTVMHLPTWQGDATFFPYAIARNPTSALLRMNHGESLYYRGDYSQSLSEFEEAARIRPHADIYSNIGAALVNLGRYDEAVEAFERSLELNPDDRQVAENLANLRRRLRR